MAERNPEFSENERLEMESISREIANMENGDDVIWDLVRAKLELMKSALMWSDSPELKELFKSPDAIFHEIDIVTGVIDQSRLLKQMAGTDEMSILDKHAQKAGLGSVFDPESQISKDFKKIGLDLFSD